MRTYTLIAKLLIALVPFIFCPATLAQTISWQSMNGPQSGRFIFTLGEDNDGHTFVSTQSPNAVYRSSNDGATWEQTDIANREVYSIKATNNNVLFAAAWDAIFRSSDHGNHWEIVSQGLDSLQITTLCINPQNVIFAGGWYKGVLKSSDNGTSWHASGLAGQTEVISLACDRVGTLFAATRDSGVYRSTDNGATWKTVDSLRFMVSSFTVNSLNVVFAGAYHGVIYRSFDSGKTWERVGPGLPTFTTVKPFLACASTDTIWVGTFLHGIFRSTNNGASWSRIKRFVSWMNVEELIFTKQGTVLAGMFRGGVFRSTDRGDSWSTSGIGLGTQPITCIAADVQGNIFAGCDAGVFMNTAGSNSWHNAVGIDSAVTPFGIQSLTMDFNHRLFAGASGAVFRTEDNGQTWSWFPVRYQTVATLTTPKNTTIAVCYYYTIQPADAFSDIFRSTDNGMTWNHVYNGSALSAIASAPNADIYAGSFRGVLKSTDDGQTWLALGVGRLFGTTAVTVPFDGCVLASTQDSLYRSADGGATWQSLGNVGTRFNVLVSARDSVVYAGTSNRGVFRSSNQGITWIEYNNGLMDSCILSLTLAPDNYLVCGTQSKGVFRSQSPVVSVSNQAAVSYKFELAQNYPNPFNSTTVIRFSVPSRAFVLLKIYDILGRLITTLLDEELPIGLYSRNWDATSSPSGVYFCKLQSGKSVSTKKLLLLK